MQSEQGESVHHNEQDGGGWVKFPAQFSYNTCHSGSLKLSYPQRAKSNSAPRVTFSASFIYIELMKASSSLRTGWPSCNPKDFCPHAARRSNSDCRIVPKKRGICRCPESRRENKRFQDKKKIEEEGNHPVISGPFPKPSSYPNLPPREKKNACNATS